MKKETVFYSFLIIFIASLILVEVYYDGNQSESNYKIIAVESFQKLNIDIPCNIYVRIGEEQKVVCEGPEWLLQNIESDIKNGILLVRTKKRSFFQNLIHFQQNDMSKLNLYVNLKDTAQLMMPTKGNVISIESFMSEEEDCKDNSLKKKLMNLLQKLTNSIA